MTVGSFEKVMNYVILILFSLYALFPILTIALTALGPQTGVQEGGLHFENLVDAWNIGRFGEAMIRSVLVALLVVSAAIVLSVLASAS